MFSWVKKGKLFDPHEVRDREWMKEFAQAPAVVIFEDIVRVYFSCRPLPDNFGQYISYSGFIDLNRNNLFEILNICQVPVLELGNLGEFDEFGTYPISIIRLGDIYYAYYGGWTRCESVPFNVAIGLCISYDKGNTFKKYGKGPILSYTIDEPFILSGPKIRMFNDKLYLWYIAGQKWITVNDKPEPIYKIRMATSYDGINWTKNNRDLIENKLNEDEVQASPDVFFSNGKYHMFFCYRYSYNYRCKENGYRIGYAFSYDIMTWTRDDSKAGIDVSEGGWDSEMLSYPHIFELDGNIYMLYLGNQFGKHGFGLAQLEGTLS